MVSYSCEKCNYTTNDKNKFVRHLNRKFDCSRKYEKNDDRSLNNKSPSVPEVFQDVPESSKKVLPICKWCNKQFSRQPNLNKHINKQRCVSRAQFLMSLDMEFVRLKKEMQEKKIEIDEIKAKQQF